MLVDQRRLLEICEKVDAIFQIVVKVKHFGCNLTSQLVVLLSVSSTTVILER